MSENFRLTGQILIWLFLTAFLGLFFLGYESTRGVNPGGLFLAVVLWVLFTGALGCGFWRGMNPKRDLASEASAREVIELGLGRIAWRRNLSVGDQIIRSVLAVGLLAYGLHQDERLLWAAGYLFVTALARFCLVKLVAVRLWAWAGHGRSIGLDNRSD